MKRIFNNIFRFIFVIVLIDLLILVELRDFYINIKPENLIKYKRYLSINFNINNFFYSICFFLNAILAKKEEILWNRIGTHKREKIAYMVLNRDKSKNKDVIIYKDDKKNMKKMLIQLSRERDELHLFRKQNLYLILIGRL